MADETFGIAVQLNPGDSVAKSKQVEDGLAKMEAAAAKAAKEMRDGMAPAARAFGELANAIERQQKRQQEAMLRSIEIGKQLDAKNSAVAVGFGQLAEQIQREASMLDRIQGPTKNYMADLGALDKLLERGKISTQQYSIEVARLNRSIDGISPALQREEAIMDAIHGPAQRMAQDLQVLNRLHDSGRISAEQYLSTLDKLGHKIPTLANVGNPIVAQRKQTELAMSTISLGSDDKGNLLKPKTPAFNPMMLAGTAAAVGFGIHELAAMDDEYRKLENSALKFADSGRNVAMVISDQTQLAHKLNLSVEGTMGAYDAVRDATDSLNLTYDQQIRLTRTVGETSALSGKSAEQMAEALYGIKVAFETGQDPGRALTTLFKQYPDLADQLTTSLGKSTGQIVAMAKSGQLSFADMTRGLIQNTGDIDEKFGRRAKLWSTTWEETKHSLEAPIDMNGVLNGMMNVDMAIERVTKDVAKQVQQWKDLEEQRKKTIFATYTPTRLDTPTQRAAELGKGRADEVKSAKMDIEALTIAYHKELIPAFEYEAKMRSLRETLYGTSDAAKKAAEALEEVAETRRAVLEFEGKSQDRIDNAAEKAYRSSLAQQQKERDAAEQQNGKDFNESLKTYQDSQGDSILNGNKAAIEAADQLQKKNEDAAKKSAEAWAQGAGQIAGNLISAAMKGEASVEDMVEQSLAALAKLALQQAAISMGGPGGAFLGSLVGALGGGANGFDYVANSNKLQLPGFAHGGDATVMGSGGTDSKIAMFRITPGESLHVRTPQQRMAEQSHSGGGGITITPTIKVLQPPERRDIVDNSFDGLTTLVRLQRRVGRSRR